MIRDWIVPPFSSGKRESLAAAGGGPGLDGMQIPRPRDGPRPEQRAFFRALQAASGKPVRLVRLVCLPDSCGYGGGD